MSAITRFQQMLSTRLLFCTLLAGMSVQALAQNELVADENQLKVAFAYNFSKYFSWPATAFSSSQNEPSNFVICIGNNTVANGEFSKLNGQLTQNRRIEIIITPTLANEISSRCHMWYLDTQSFNNNQVLLEQTRPSPVLTVSDAPGSRNSGAVIELAVVNNRIQFRINMELMSEKNLSASAFLLRLAQ